MHHRINACVPNSGAYKTARISDHGTCCTPRLLDRVRDKIRVKHYSIRTEQAYVDWIKRFIRYHGKRHPADMAAADVDAFLTDLAVAGRVAASTQNQAKSALLFLYKEVLGVELPWLDRIEKAKAPAHLPIVLTREEIACVLARLSSVHSLVGRLLYGTGMRVMEGMRLRVKDVDFARSEILVRDGKGMKDRVTILPRTIVSALQAKIDTARTMHRHDLALGFGAVWLPHALARKYPQAARDWARQYVFPADERSRDPRSGVVRRHHLSDQSFQRAMRQAVRDAGLAKPATPHTLRHSFATHLLESGYDIRTARSSGASARRGAPHTLRGSTGIASRRRRPTRCMHIQAESNRRPLGHSSVATTMIYTHVLNRGGRAVVSPLDRHP